MNLRNDSQAPPDNRSMSPPTDDSSSARAQEEYRVKTYVRRLLRDELFVGSFGEKRYVAEIGQYRHVVQVDATEKPLIEKLRRAVRAIRKQYVHEWLGVTFDDGPSPQLWVELEREVVGTYWYRIKGVHFGRNEIVVRLQQQRAFDERRPTLDDQVDLGSMLRSKLVELLTDFLAVLTFANIKAATVYISVLLVAAVAGFWQVVQFVGEYSLRFMRETSYFVHNASPLMVSVVETCGKVIGGLYILLAMMWRDFFNGSRTPTATSRPMIQYTPSYRRQRSGVVIQEITD